MDGATIKGVVDRLRARNLVRSQPDPSDGRRHLVELTDHGNGTVERAIPAAWEVTEKTLQFLDQAERATLVRLLRRIA